MAKKVQHPTIKKLHRLADADMVFWLMPALIALLIAGTIAQRWIGLFRAHEMFFSSFIFFLGPVPLPGGFTVLGLLSAHLTLKFMLKSEWSWRKSGIILSHMGALILLIGGLMTALFAKESYMIIAEGNQSPYIYSYTERNLSIFNDRQEIARLNYDNVKNWENAELPFKIKAQNWCNNCAIEKRETKESIAYQSMAAFMQLKNAPEEAEPEANLTGVEFEITGTDKDGTYIGFDGMPKPIELTKGENTYTLIFGKAQEILPFSIALKDFVKDDYEGTEMARAYHSDIIVKDGDLEWPVRIEMNAPLRYKGYTFFQSSFRQTAEHEMSVFAVVENKGWLFPYIGALIIGAGLLLHTILVMREQKP
jgi:hypothetical protein